MTVKELDFSPFHPKNISLQDFEVQNKIKKELKVKVREWTEQYCDAITENYRQYHIRTLKGNLSGNYPEYAQKQLDELENGTAKLMKFRINEGRKYYKIIQQEYREASDYFKTEAGYRDGSVHSFVDKNTGEVYMAASWNKPAKHVRFDMRIIKERTLMHTPSFVTWAGGYLYLR
tara:strand:- start:350 stop:874 length:525 start_codon:yes stop_codon:yes gene_type:complete